MLVGEPFWGDGWGSCAPLWQGLQPPRPSTNKREQRTGGIEGTRVEGAKAHAAT